MKFLTMLVGLCLTQYTLLAQIPVADEPLHHVIFEDPQVRVLEIIAVPGDTAQMHQHDYNYCYIAAKGGKLWLEDLGKESRTVNLPDHYCGGKFDLANNPFVHRFANIDTSEIRFFTIEHKTGLAIPRPAADKRDHIILESDLFVVRKMELPPMTSLDVQHDKRCFLLNLSADPSLYSDNQSVSYWQQKQADEKIHLSNMSEEPILIAVFEIY